MHIIVLAHELAGIAPEGENKSLADALKRSDGPEVFRRVFQRELEIGDIVFAYGSDLGQIVETARSKHGNTSYKIRYLVRPMLEGIEEDWFPARYIRLLYRRRDIKPAMIDAARRMGSTEEQLKTFERLDDAGAARILARTFVEMERQGVLPLMLRAPREERG